MKKEQAGAGVGVVLSSGFFGFYAHAGFLSGIRKLGIRADGYAGSSSGAILAAMAASGMSDSAIKGILFDLRKKDFWDPDPWPSILRAAFKLFKGTTGYLKGESFGTLLEKLPIERIEDCPVPLAVVSTNLSLKKETVFTRGNLRDAVRASGLVPLLFKPMEIDGAFHVDGGIVNKAPIKVLADLIGATKIIVHFIASGDIKENRDRFLTSKLTPFHIHQLAVNIARQESYKRQCEILEQRGVEIIKVETDTPTVGPNRLDNGPLAFEKARKTTLEVLSQKAL